MAVISKTDSAMGYCWLLNAFRLKGLLSAIASALHTSTMPITGQLSAAVEKNPGVWLNTSQPLCKAFMVSDEDIRY